MESKDEVLAMALRCLALFMFFLRELALVMLIAVHDVSAVVWAVEEDVTTAQTDKRTFNGC
jgi:hypothetical protein